MVVAATAIAEILGTVPNWVSNHALVYGHGEMLA